MRKRRHQPPGRNKGRLSVPPDLYHRIRTFGFVPGSYNRLRRTDSVFAESSSVGIWTGFFCDSRLDTTDDIELPLLAK